MTYQLPPLRFAYHDLEPHFPAELIRRHVEIHHQGYTDGINAILRAHPELDGNSIEDLMRVVLPGLPEPLRAQVAHIGGGHADHQFFWKIIGPSGNGAPKGDLAVALEQTFGSFQKFRDRFIEAALAHQGAGWAFLSMDRIGDGHLEILTLPNNGSVLPIGKPGIVICDLWEHAYESRYGDSRADYLEAFFRVIDWDVCGARIVGIREGRKQM
jgi:Fe-Mn family superoxide dismutase